MQRLVKQDHSDDEFVQPASRKEQLTIAASGFFRRRNINVGELSSAARMPLPLTRSASIVDSIAGEVICEISRSVLRG